MKPLFIRGPSVGFRVLALLVVSVALMVVDHRGNELERLRAVLSLVVYPLQYVVNLPAEGYGWLSEALHTHRALLADNAQLREQNLLLKQRSQKFAALQAENMRLRELLDSSLEVDERVLVADLLAVEVDPGARQVVLNKGTRHGVFMGQAFVDADGVMGQVLHVGPVTSTGMLVTDVNHALPVQVNRSGVLAVAMGTGLGDVLRLAYVPNHADIREGDLIVTSGMGGRFPPGYPVGHVKTVTLEAGEPFASIIAVPTAQLTRSRQVLLVWTQDGAPSPLSKTVLAQ